MSNLCIESIQVNEESIAIKTAHSQPICIAKRPHLMNKHPIHLDPFDIALPRLQGSMITLPSHSFLGLPHPPAIPFKSPPTHTRPARGGVGGASDGTCSVAAAPSGLRWKKEPPHVLDELRVAGSGALVYSAARGTYRADRAEAAAAASRRSVPEKGAADGVRGGESGAAAPGADAAGKGGTGGPGAAGMIDGMSLIAVVIFRGWQGWWKRRRHWEEDRGLGHRTRERGG